jgi:hypothetical protein
MDKAKEDSAGPLKRKAMPRVGVSAVKWTI